MPEDGGDIDEPGDESDEGAPEGSGPNIEVLLTDAPGDFDEVWVNITSVGDETDGGEAPPVD